MNKIRYHILDRPRLSEPIPEEELVSSLHKRRESLHTPVKMRNIVTTFGNTKRFEDPKLYQHQINE